MDVNPTASVVVHHSTLETKLDSKFRIHECTIDTAAEIHKVEIRSQLIRGDSAVFVGLKRAIAPS